MTFEEILNQTMKLLERQGRVSYRALKRQFGLDDAYLDDLKFEIVEVHKIAVDQDDVMLVWTGVPGVSHVVIPPTADQTAAIPTPPSSLVGVEMPKSSPSDAERRHLTV